MDIKLLDTLERQHREVEALFKKLENATEEDEQTTLVQELDASLTEHMQIEENQVYPELANLDAEMSQEAEVEHGLAREGLSTLKGLIGQPGFGAAVAMLQAGIAHHVEEEEKEAFPTLRKAMGAPAQAASGEEPTRDELYQKAQEQGIEGRSHMTKAELADAVSHGSGTGK
jgi:hemerythrin-like domain-containing protein